MKGGRAAIEQDWQARGFSCGVTGNLGEGARLKLGHFGLAVQDYTHSTDELLMVLEGELELEMHGRTFRPKR